LLVSYQYQPSEAIAYLVLRAWTAAPEVYADRLAEYLSTDSRRLTIGYQSGTGSFELYVSKRAVASASQKCSHENFAKLEQAILSLRIEWEAKLPQFRGRTQLELLQALDPSRLSTSGLAKLKELQRKFPLQQHEEPQEERGGFVGSPISQQAQSKMSDENWLQAMNKYANVGFRVDKGSHITGGGQQLATGLTSQSQSDPARFANLAAERMQDELPHIYFEAIIMGIAEAIHKVSVSPTFAELEAAAIIRRVHGLPNRPCGRSIAWLLQRGSALKWPADVINILAWYAANDPDPRVSAPGTPMANVSPPQEMDIYGVGRNSVRGAAADAIGAILRDQPEMFDHLQTAVHSLAIDPSAGVRSCAIFALFSCVPISPGKAIVWFKECIAVDPVVLGTRYVENFVQHAGYTDFAAIRPVIDEMLNSRDTRVVEAAARVLCLLGLDLQEIQSEVERAEKGSRAMRLAAAQVYATNIAHKTVGSRCRSGLKQFFSDPDPSIRTQAASAFKHIADLETAAQTDLLTAFLETQPGPTSLSPVVLALEHSPVQLPDLVCRVVSLCLDTYRGETTVTSQSQNPLATSLSKIVVRLYAQTEDVAIQAQCLSLIDEMERCNFLGLSRELQQLDR
jgi:hypothetical protein